MKKTLFLSAILGAALCSSAFADSATTANTVKDGVTYNGGIYTLSGTGNFSKRTFTADMDSTDGSIKANSTTGWTSFASGGSRVYGHTLHLTTISTDSSVNTDFDPFTVGGLIVDDGTGTWTVGRAGGNDTLTQVWGAGAANMDINGSVTLLGGKGVQVKSGGTWDIAEGKTLTLSTGGKAQSVSFDAGTTVTLSGKGTLALSGATLSFGTGSKIIVGESNTLALTTGSDWTMVGGETSRTSGNGFGTATYTRDFGTSIVNNGTITVNGSEATMNDGVVTGTGNSTTYYVNEGAYTTSLPGATKLVVNSTSGGDNRFGMSNTAYGNLDITINGGRVITAKTGNGTGFTSGDVVINGGGTLAVVESGQDALGWDNGVKTRSLTLEGTAENNKATFELSYNPEASLTLATDLNMNGHSQVTGTRAFNTYGGVITATGTDNVISAGVQLRKAASFVVNADSTLLISGNVTYGASNDRSMTKTGAGVLTISGNISGNSATELVAITGDGANTVISSGTISHATLNNVKLAKGSAQTITGTVTLNNATLTNRLNVNGAGSLTLQNGATATQTSGFSMVVDGNATLTFDAGTYDLSKPSDGLAIYTGSAMTVKDGASLTVNKICYSYNQPEKNGNVTVENGGVLTLTSGNSYVNILSVSGTATVGGNLHTEDKLAVSGSYTQNGGTATVKTFTDLADNATLTLGNGSMDVQGTAGNQGIWFHSGSHIDLTGTGTLTADGMVISKGEGEASIKSTASVAQIGSNTDDYNKNLTFTNTNVKVTGDVLRPYTFVGGSVTVASGAVTTIKSALSATTDLIVNAGSAATFSGDATFGSLTLSNGANLTAETISGEHDGTVNITGLTVNGNSEMDANLVVSGGTMTFANGAVLTMGCTVSIGATDTVTVVLTQEMVNSIAQGEWVEIINGVDDIATLGNIRFEGADGVQLDRPVYQLAQIGDKIYITPEPATATLSLLALAALAARRRRH